MALMTLQTIFQEAFPAYEQTYPLPAHVRKVARAIMQCQTAALGDPVQACPDGHVARIWYNSCQHCSCSPCADLQTARWLAFQQARLPACDHYHGIFPKRRHSIMSEALIRTATAADTERCLAVLTLAFGSDPPCRWAWPDPQQYLEAFPRFAQAFGGSAIEHGTANYYEGFSDAALWLPPGVAPDEASLVRVIQDTVAAAQRNAMFAMFEQMDAFHPREEHWHLPLIGVDPAYQGKGIGSALLRHALHACDRHKVLAYLEATSSQNVPLYERHGFEALGSIQVADAPPVVPMVRKPR
jgi:ribosomal protein S18 acetylase RimI-like enzyme